METIRVTGEINAKLEPRYAGKRPLQIAMYKSVPIPFIKSAIEGSTFSKNGTSTVAPNMANKC